MHILGGEAKLILGVAVFHIGFDWIQNIPLVNQGVAIMNSEV